MAMERTFGPDWQQAARRPNRPSSRLLAGEQQRRGKVGIPSTAASIVRGRNQKCPGDAPTSRGRTPGVRPDAKHDPIYRRSLPDRERRLMAKKTEAKFARIVPRFWTDEKAHEWSDSQQKLALYLLTCQHRNLQGLYRLPLNYAAEDLNWSLSKVKKYLAALEAEGFCEYDDQAKVVLVKNTLRYYQPSNDDQVTAALRALAEVPATPLKRRFTQLAQAHDATLLADHLMNGEGGSDHE